MLLSLLVVGSSAHATDRDAPSVSQLKHRYLRPDAREIPSVDAIVSLRPSLDHADRLMVRDWYNAWLSYWPMQFGGGIVFYTEATPVMTELQRCLEAPPTCAPLKARFETYNRTRDLNRAEFRSNQDPFKRIEFSNPTLSKDDTKWVWEQVSMYKFDADTVSDASILAYTDDDSCMQDCTPATGPRHADLSFWLPPIPVL